MKVLILGGKGELTSSLVQKAVDAGIDVIAIDLPHPPAFKYMLRHHSDALRVTKPEFVTPLDLMDFKAGDKVYFNPHPNDLGINNPEKGIIKSVSPVLGTAFVVYGEVCSGDWKNYKKYTGQSTNLTDLVAGWPEEEEGKD